MNDAQDTQDTQDTQYAQDPQSEQMGASFPKDPKAVLEMMTQYYKKAMQAMSNREMPGGLPMDPSQFLKTFEELIKRMSSGFGGGGQFPTSPEAMMKYLQDAMKSMSGGSGAEMLDPRRFFETFNKLFQSGPFAQFTANGGPGLKDVINPGWWFKMGEETMRQGTQMMGMGAPPKPEEEKTQE